MKTHRSTRASRGQDGQILVIVAGGMVLFLGIMALVIDLGFVFMLRRQEQNAADPGALAAARYIPTADRASMWTAACFLASQNGFTPRRSDNNDSCVAGLPPDDSTLTVNWPPSQAAVEYAGKRGYVEVTITRPHKSFFAGIVGLPTITVTTAAVAANDTGAAGSSSLVALNPTACPAAKLHGGGGSGGVLIYPATGVPPGAGGYVQVNSICGYDNGANDNCMDGPKGGLEITGGTEITSNTIYIQGACSVNGGVATINPPTTFDEQAAYVGDPLALVRPPLPADLATKACPGKTLAASGSPTAPKKCNINGVQTVSPGTYYGGWTIGNGTTLTLEAGIYIIAGGGISQTGGLVAASGRVLIYSTDSPVCTGSGVATCQQKVDFAGNGSLDLRGLDKNAECLPYGSPGCPFGGLLIWQDGNASGKGTASSNVELGGGTSLRLEGTIYAPAGDVKITGNSLGTGCALTGSANCSAIQIIADTWDVGGAGVLNMPYDPSKFYNPLLKGLVR